MDEERRARVSRPNDTGVTTLSLLAEARGRAGSSQGRCAIAAMPPPGDGSLHGSRGLARRAPRTAVMSNPSAASLLRFLIQRFTLSIPDLIDLREAIDAHLRERVGMTPPKERRTLYLPADSLDDL
jgi:hypothetical protein